MKRNFFTDGKLSGKSTAAILCFCLAAVAALGIFSYNKSAEELENELSAVKNSTSETTAASEEQLKEANVPAENVPITEAAAPQENVILEQDAFGSDNSSENTPAAEQVQSDELTDAVIIPVNGDVLVEYSNGDLVKSKTLSVWKTHDGIDIAAEAGSPVKAMTSGTVMNIENDPLMGITVVIDHGSGYEGYYCNLSREVSVAEGDAVSAGTVIGEVGNTAESEISEESHLHFGLKKNGSWTNPAEVLSGEGS